MSSEHLVFNGVNGMTGDYLLPALSSREVTALALGRPLEAAHLSELKWRFQQSVEPALRAKEGIDHKDLAQTGWGVIFAADSDPAIREALGELLNHRQAQAAATHAGRYQEFTGRHAYRPGETKGAFLARLGAGPGPVDPDRVPYYLLLVGSPEQIPYRFQHQLDVQHAVGRIWFDTPTDYANYARSVVATETGLAQPRRVVFFGVQNPDDPVTDFTARNLVQPLAKQTGAEHPSWEVRTLLQEEATKTRLLALLDGSETPAFLFTASHGVGFPNGDPRQISEQGALVCQEWPGPLGPRGKIPRDFYLAADDIGADARPGGLVSFHFGCYSAGTPHLDEYAHRGSGDRLPIAPHAFVAALPKRLLGHANGGALAVVGHVERAWSYSFRWQGAGRQLEVFRSSLKRLLEGHPVGSAFEWFNERYAELSTVLSEELEEIKYGKLPDHDDLAGLWTANNDARSYAIVGDPAVRLNVGPG